MGMYSSTEYCELKVKEGKEIEFADWLKQNNDWNEVVTIDSCLDVDIQVNWKIIGYWYNDFLDELEQLAEYIVGTWTLEYETNEAKAIIEFTEDEQVKITLGEMEFKKLDIDELRIHNVETDEIVKALTGLSAKVISKKFPEIIRKIKGEVTRRITN